MNETISLLLLFSIFISCKNSDDSEYENIVKKLVGKEIFLPKISQTHEQFKLEGKLKIVTRINGNCYPCINSLKDWKPFVEKLSNKYQIPFLIYVVSADTSVYMDINRNGINFEYPIIFDANDEFKKNNNLPQNSIFHTMLLSDSNKIILIGNPIGNTKLQKLYYNQISKFIIDN